MLNLVPVIRLNASEIVRSGPAECKVTMGRREALNVLRAIHGGVNLCVDVTVRWAVDLGKW